MSLTDIFGDMFLRDIFGDMFLISKACTVVVHHFLRMKVQYLIRPHGEFPTGWADRLRMKPNVVVPAKRARI